MIKHPRVKYGTRVDRAKNVSICCTTLHQNGGILYDVRTGIDNCSGAPAQYELLRPKVLEALQTLQKETPSTILANSIQAQGG